MPLGHESDRVRAGGDAGHRAGRHQRDGEPGDLHLSHVAVESDDAIHRDDQQRRADGIAHLQTARTSAGTMRKPPPTPTSPVSDPTTSPWIAVNKTEAGVVVAGDPASVWRRRSMKPAATSMIVAKMASCSAPLSRVARRVPTYVPTLATAPKISATRTFTRPSRP